MTTTTAKPLSRQHLKLISNGGGDGRPREQRPETPVSRPYRKSLSMIENKQLGHAVDVTGSDRHIRESLKGIDAKLTTIETKLEKLVRLEEKVNTHDTTLSKLVGKVDKYGDDINTLKMQNAVAESSWSKNLSAIERDLLSVRAALETVSSNQTKNSGRQEITNAVLKWACAILAALLIWKLKGSP